MATTPNYSWVMPDPADLVKDLPADFKTFGDAVDATVDGIDDRVDVIEALPIDIIPTGLSVYTRPYNTAPLGGTGTVTEDVTYYTPIFLPTCTLDRISIRTGATSPAGVNTTRLGIYRSGADFRPSTVLLDAGTVDPNAANTNFEITISQAVTKGLYYLAFNRQASGATPPNFNRVDDGTGAGMPFASSIQTSAIWATGFSQTGVTGAFATAGTLAIENGDLPAVWVRVA
jgi:hypothetical protein